MKDEGLANLLEFMFRVYEINMKVLHLQQCEITVQGAIKMSHTLQPKHQH